MKKHAFTAVLSSTAAITLAMPVAAKEGGIPTLQETLGSDDFTISASVRTRYETYDNTFRSGGAEEADLLSIRTIIKAEYDAGPVRIGGQLQDARAYAANDRTPLSTADVNALELVEAYLTAELGDALGAGSNTELTAGRFLLKLGSKRLAASPGFRNTANGFTGVRADWSRKDRGQAATLFYTLPQQRLPSDRSGLLNNAVEWDRESHDLRFWGGIVSSKLAGSAVTMEVYTYRLDEEDSAQRATNNRHLVTPGFRLFSASKKGKLDFEVEAAWQTGTTRTSKAASAPEVDVSAHTIAAEVGYTFDHPANPRIPLVGDIASGDDPEHASYNRFDTLFGIRRGEWGPSSSLYGPLSRNNIRDLGAKFEIKPSKRFDAFVSARAAWLDEKTDSFAKTGIRDATGQSGRYAGEQVEARIRYWLMPDFMQIDIGGALLAKGRFLRSAPNVTDIGDTRYFYADLYFNF
ncbi:Alginate export [Altererythrobacter xiamenensis]|uniref:Alginate export n=1 Tax=Altererythrobacter xiamenensis TaxID=1316679 RepID=A0A1Y6EK34_9SPHN|nr:alginate export family protein [Altererythrobacter xiamenensis]SMQ62709.1 Alginate export [Altererythrobacter xiamenensis]